MKKYFLTFPTKNGQHIKDFGDNYELALKTAQLYFEADKDGYIKIIEEMPNHHFVVRLPNLQYLEEPANTNQPWTYLDDYKAEADAIKAAKKYGANDDGRIKVIDDDFLEEFTEIHLVLKLKKYSEYPQLDLTDVYRGGIIDEYLDAFKELKEEKIKDNSRSAFNLIKEIDINFEATDDSQTDYLM